MEVEKQNRRCWLAAYTRSRHEQHVADQLKLKDLEFLLPMYQHMARWSDRVKSYAAPLFPGYIFVHVHLDNYANVDIVRTPAALCFVRDSRGPLSIPDYQIGSLQTMLNAAQPLTIHSYLKEGEQVKVIRGFLAGCVGILDRVDPKKGRLVVNLHIFRKSVSTELDIEDVEPNFQ